MKVNLFYRHYYHNQISIEKLFATLKLEMVQSGISVMEYTNPYLLNPMGILKALFYFKSKQGKINHITGDITWCSFLLRKKCTIITIHDLGGMNELKGIKRRIFFLWWIYLPIQRSRFVTVISQKTKDDILQFLPKVQEKIIVIPNCFTTPVTLETAKKWNAVPEILIVGTRENKNIENIILALKGFDCTLTIIGTLTKDHVKLLNACAINYKNLKFVSDEALATIYNKSDILTFISKFEGFGLPILEANAQNCAVITSNIQPMMDVAYNAAYFVDPQDVISIKNGIKKVWQDENLRNTLIDNGRDNVKRFEPKEIAQQYISLYKQI